MFEIPSLSKVIPVFNKSLNKAARVVEKKLPTILAGGAIGCLGLAVYSAATGMHKADRIIFEEEQRREETLPEYNNKELTAQDKVRLTWKEFAPAAFFTTAAVLLIIASERKGHEKYLALMSAYELSKQALDERKEAEADVLPEDGLKLIDERVRNIKADAADIPEELIPHVTRDGDETLYIESVTKTPFYAKESDVLHAFNKLNHVRNRDDKASISDFMEDLDLRTSPASDFFGWNNEYGSLIEPYFVPEHLDGDPTRPATLIEYSIEPTGGCGLDHVQY